jgi:hypothetical protein
MEVLWLAILIYSMGLAGVLHVRPALMFHENGTWKEFGYQRSSGHTLFPFWLFAITWAFVSYALATAIAWMVPTSGAAMATAAVATMSYGDEEDDDELTAATEMPSTPAPRTKKARPGYYVLDPASREGGLRRYIYYGPQPPADEE